MSDESEVIDSRVTPGLHPRNVHEIDGYCDEVASILSETEVTFATAYQWVGAVHDAREAAKQNAIWNESQQQVETADFAYKTMEAITLRFDRARANLQVVADGVEKQLSAPIDASTYGSIASEIRGHVKSLKIGERLGFVRQMIISGDKRSAQAILGGPAFLSGLEADWMPALTRMYHEHHEPRLANRLKAAQAGIELLDNRSGLLFTQMEKAIGTNLRKIGQIRERRAAASKAFTLPKA